MSDEGPTVGELLQRVVAGGATIETLVLTGTRTTLECHKSSPSCQVRWRGYGGRNEVYDLCEGHDLAAALILFMDAEEGRFPAAVLLQLEEQELRNINQFQQLLTEAGRRLATIRSQRERSKGAD